jgi:hypothetical protein
MCRQRLLVVISLILMVYLHACNLIGPSDETQDILATWVAATLTALEVQPAFPTLTPIPPGNTFPPLIPAASDTAPPAPTSTPLSPLVLETALCWEGPGPQFDVVSALKKDERVQLIGRTTLAGWWIVDNPIYHDPCWVQAKYLQIEPGYDIFALPIFTPVPTPTLTPTDTRTPTNTATLTNTPTPTSTP